ncbi:hypothetical protein, partial [Mesorhizobium waimense]|uniref:hypothetical protein n=1 Tax=Mesorhizobium waimense TaxID=1300307 RepID=UPI001ABF2819
APRRGSAGQFGLLSLSAVEPAAISSLTPAKRRRKGRQRQQAEMTDGTAPCQAGRGFLTAEVRSEDEKDVD